MIRHYCVFLFLVTISLLSISTLAQIPNAGFENWTGTEPDGWFTNNFPGIAQPVQQSSTSHGGLSSVKAEIVSVSGFPYGALLYSGFPDSQRHAALTGYYQLNQMGTDSLSIVVTMVKDHLGVGGGVFFTAAQTSAWTPFNIDIQYYSGETPDSAYIYIASGSTTIGSYALVDDLAFMGISDIQKKENPNLVEEFQLKQNYPNPFNPTTNIEFSIPQSSNVKLVVYNQLGQAVATLVNERLSSGIYSVDWNAEGFPSGIYFYEMTAGDFSKTMKLILMR